MAKVVALLLLLTAVPACGGKLGCPEGTRAQSHQELQYTMMPGLNLSTGQYDMKPGLKMVTVTRCVPA